MMAGIALPVLLMISAGAIDLHHMAKVRSELQDALDAATLAVARSNSTTAAEVQNIGMASLRANMPGYYIGNSGDVAAFTLDGKSKVQATATVQVRTIVANIFLPPYGKLMDDYMPMSASSDVMRASRNVEVVMALDITQSIGNELTNLKNAALELTGIIVQTDQAVYTSKVGVVPYAASVNVGSYADKLRGSYTTSSRSSSRIHWSDSSRVNSGSRSISNRVNLQINSSNHQLVVGNWVWVDGSYNFKRYSTQRSMSASNYQFPARVISATNNSFVVKFIPSDYLVGYDGSYSVSSAYFRKCSYEGCDVKITTGSGQAFSNGSEVIISGYSNSLGSNAAPGIVSKVVGSDYYVNVGTRSTGSSARGQTSAVGKIECGAYGCQNRAYMNSINLPAHAVHTNCVSERHLNGAVPTDDVTGPNRYMGRAYMQASGYYSCPSVQILPLSSDKALVEGRIKGLTLSGITGGQIGIEMSWYMLSPHFSSVFGSSVANAYNSAETIKAAIIMTDGEFNTPYCEGVIYELKPVDDIIDNLVRDNYINCPSGGVSRRVYYERAEAICTQMKAAGIVVYTIGFKLIDEEGSAGTDTAVELLRSCATSSENFHFTSSGSDLQNAFRAIGRDITRLRIAR